MKMVALAVAAANAVATATVLLMITVSLDCLVTALYLREAGGALHVVPLTRGIVAGRPALVLGLPCAVLAVAWFVKEKGTAATR